MNTACIEYLPEIVQRLKRINPYRIVLFGSNVSEQTDEESDIDLFIVLDIDDIPHSYDEKIDLKLMVRKAIQDISLKIPIDLLVYTKPEYKAFVEQRSSFSREIMEKGRLLYEKES